MHVPTHDGRTCDLVATRGSTLRAEMGEIPLNMRAAQDWAAGDQSREQVVETLSCQLVVGEGAAELDVVGVAAVLALHEEV